jgi:thiol-disulfide isomerase/thioredoxin
MRSLFKSFTSYISFAIIIANMIACSGIDLDERLISIDPIQPVDSVGTDSVQQKQMFARAVLIEDFTGQGCSNCPDAAEVINNLQQKYGSDTVIAVAIHASDNAERSKGSRIGLRTDEGDAYFDHWQVGSEPNGLINRMDGVCYFDKWPGRVRKALEQPTPVALALTNNYTAERRQANIDLTVTVSEDVNGTVQLGLIENNIVARQKMQDNRYKADYVHNHVFRHTVNGTWGESFTVTERTDSTLHYAVHIDEGWQPQNMAVVAFIYDGTGVLQVTEAPLILQESVPEQESNPENKE